MKSTTRDNIIYLSVGLAIVGIAGLIIWYQDSHDSPIHVPISDGTFGFFLVTAVVFGFAIKAFRRLWSRKRFWFFLGFVIYLPLQWRVSHFAGGRIGLNSLIATLELFLVLVLVEKLVQHKAARSEEHNRQISHSGDKPHVKP